MGLQGNQKWVDHPSHVSSGEFKTFPSTHRNCKGASPVFRWPFTSLYNSLSLPSEDLICSTLSLVLLASAHLWDFWSSLLDCFTQITRGLNLLDGSPSSLHCHHTIVHALRASILSWFQTLLVPFFIIFVFLWFDMLMKRASFNTDIKWRRDKMNSKLDVGKWKVCFAIYSLWAIFFFFFFCSFPIWVSSSQKRVTGSYSLPCLFVCLFCCFTSQVNSYGHCGTVSSPNPTFSWAGLNKRLTSNSCTYFRL